MGLSSPIARIVGRTTAAHAVLCMLYIHATCTQYWGEILAPFLCSIPHEPERHGLKCIFTSMMISKQNLYLEHAMES